MGPDPFLGFGSLSLERMKAYLEDLNREVNYYGYLRFLRQADPQQLEFFGVGPYAVTRLESLVDQWFCMH